MAFALLDNPTPQLYPLYSDMENSDIECTLSNRLNVPVPSPRRRNLRNSNNSPISRNYQHYKSMMQRRANRRHKKYKNTLSPFTAHTAHIPHTHLHRYNTYNHACVHIDSTPIPPKPMPQTQTFHTHTRAQMPQSKPIRKKRGKRRIRTFYSKKWGNKLYGLTKHYPIISKDTLTPQTQSKTAENMNDIQRSLSAFIEEENLDLNDIRSPSPSVPIDHSLLNIDYRFNDNMAYDSNTAINTDIDSDIEDRFCNSDHRNFKIVISEPEGNANVATAMYNHNRNREIEFNNLINAKLVNMNDLNARRMRYLSSDNESEDMSSDSESDNGMGCGTGTGTEALLNSLFLAQNNMNFGVYSDFNSETDYLSAQSGDFDELTICYHNQKNGKNRRKNIRFRDNYLSDIGPSDIGSSDTEYFSSADSIPDSVPDSIPESVDLIEALSKNL